MSTAQSGAPVPQPEWNILDRLHKSLREAGLSTSAIAAQLGVHRNTVANYLYGKTAPDRRTLVTWALATGFPLEWLQTGEVAPPNPDGPGLNSQTRHLTAAASGGISCGKPGGDNQTADIVPFHKVA